LTSASQHGYLHFRLGIRDGDRMPRPNPRRTINVETSLARRIAYERDRHGWNNDSLAKRMADAGCAMHPSAIHKIEKSDPPRRVTVNELIAFANVFELTVEDLLQPVEVLLVGKAHESFERWAAAFAESDRAFQHLTRAEVELADLLKERPEIRTAVRQAVRTWVKDNYGYDEEEPVELMMRQFEQQQLSVPVDHDTVTAHRKEVEQS
jgi:hypothetical protein